MSHRRPARRTYDFARRPAAGPQKQAPNQPSASHKASSEISPRAWAERERDRTTILMKCPSEVVETVLEMAEEVTRSRKMKTTRTLRTDEDVAVRSITLGALSPGHAPARPSGWGERRQRLAELLAEFGDKILPEGFPFASIQLNYAYASAMHTDKSNDGRPRLLP